MRLILEILRYILFWMSWKHKIFSTYHCLLWCILYWRQQFELWLSWNSIYKIWHIYYHNCMYFYYCVLYIISLWISENIQSGNIQVKYLQVARYLNFCTVTSQHNDQSINAIFMYNKWYLSYKIHVCFSFSCKYWPCNNSLMSGKNYWS